MDRVHAVCDVDAVGKSKNVQLSSEEEEAQYELALRRWVHQIYCCIASTAVRLLMLLMTPKINKEVPEWQRLVWVTLHWSEACVALPAFQSSKVWKVRQLLVHVTECSLGHRIVSI
jgi:hypothetical protein